MTGFRHGDAGVMRESLPFDDWRELAVRANDGLEISLLWNKSIGRLKLHVDDTKLGSVFEFEVAAADGLAAFHHPFVYASGHDRCLGNAMRGCRDPQSQNLVIQRSAD